MLARSVPPGSDRGPAGRRGAPPASWSFAPVFTAEAVSDGELSRGLRGEECGGDLMHNSAVARIMRSAAWRARTTLEITVNGVAMRVELEGVSEEARAEAARVLRAWLGDPMVKNRDAIKEAFMTVLRLCPDANASDIWHHVVYRLYCEILPESRHQNPGQSWVRAGGEALECIVEEIYRPALHEHGIDVRALISKSEKAAALAEMGLTGSVGQSKLDVGLYVQRTEGRAIFGCVHVKASLAERVSDDVPASERMIAAGFFSPLWTLDVKSFPPPDGDLVNRGELGSPESPSDKRL